MSTNKPSVSSAIVGSFDPIDGMPPNVKNTWAFEYDKSQDTISFQVQVSVPPVDNATQNLRATIAKGDIDQLINWLSVVKMNLN